jgi:hypothetical protein
MNTLLRLLKMILPTMKIVNNKPGQTFNKSKAGTEHPVPALIINLND